MDPLYDLLIHSMLATPAIIGAAYGWGGWRAAAWASAASLLGLPALLVLWGLLPETNCAHCVDLGLYMPVVWLFVLALSRGAILIAMIPAALVGWALGRWLRSVDDDSRLDRI